MTPARRPGAHRARWWTVTAACFTLWPLGTVSEAVAQVRPYHERGLGVSAVYEGWVVNEDGSLSMLFGYMNENWVEELDVPVGPENYLAVSEPGGLDDLGTDAFDPATADRGQPTHFLPRRNRFVFEVPVPADFGDRELVWTLRTREGVTERAYGSLRRDYALDRVTIMSETGAAGSGRGTSEELRANLPPEAVLEGRHERMVRVGEPVELVVRVSDDGLPPPRGFQAPDPDATPRELLQRALDPPVRVTIDKAVGLHVTWFLYRGTGTVTFDEPQPKPWEDTRAFQNSPWSPFWVPPPEPEDGRWRATATFHEPGTYVLRGRVDDGGLWDDLEVTVRVRGPAAD